MKKLRVLALFLFVMSLSGAVFAQQYKPSIQFNSMLNGAFEILPHPEGGVFKHRELYATNIPATNQNGTAVVKLDGKEIGVFSWVAYPRDVLYTQLVQFQLTQGKKHPLGLVITAGGNYEVEYRLADGTPFYKFPFKLERTGGGDAYDVYANWKFEGDWADYAYMIMDDKGLSSEKWRFVFWLREFGGSDRSAIVTAEISRDKDGAKIARSSNTIKPTLNWTRHDLTFTATFDPKGIPFKLDTLKTVNGKYTLKLKVNDEVLNEYKFEVVNGEIPISGRQIRETTDPLRFIEGGGKSIWLKKN